MSIVTNLCWYVLHNTFFKSFLLYLCIRIQQFQIRHCCLCFLVFSRAYSTVDAALCTSYCSHICFTFHDSFHEIKWHGQMLSLLLKFIWYGKWHGQMILLSKLKMIAKMGYMIRLWLVVLSDFMNMWLN